MEGESSPDRKIPSQEPGALPIKGDVFFLQLSQRMKPISAHLALTALSWMICDILVFSLSSFHFTSFLTLRDREPQAQSQNDMDFASNRREVRGRLSEKE